MGSKLEGGPIDNIASREEEDTFAFVADSVVKSGEYDMPEKSLITLSHLLSSDSGQDSSTENAEITQTIRASVVHDASVENAEHKQTIKASIVHDASGNVVLNPEAVLDAVEDSNFLQDQTNSAGCCLFSLDASKTSDLLDRRTCCIADEQHRRNCNKENNSCSNGCQDPNNANHGHPEELKKKVMGCHFDLTDNYLTKNDEKNIHKEAIDDCNNSGPEEGETNCKGNTTIFMKSSTTYCSKDANPCHNTDGIQDPISSSNMSSKFQFSCSGSQNKESSQCAMDDGSSSMTIKLFFGNDDGKKDISDGEASNEDSVKSQPQLVSSEGIDECLGTENGGNGFKRQEEVKSRGSNEQSDMPKSKHKMSQGLLQPVVEGEDSEEEDVKVCVICGDEGQEELLAICSRCSDGAEHTYCMRIMSVKVTEDEWLCEECQLKEAADKVTGKSEAQISRIESPPHEENNQNNEFSMENKAIDPDIRRNNEELANLLPSKRKREAMEVKVCVICGDQGQEEWLAICSRCSDGAEHTYCMRIMSAKVTEGEWLCEECQLKETADKVTGKSEAQISRIGSPPPEENNQNNESSMENKAIDPDIRRDNEELANLLPSKRKREAMEVKVCVICGDEGQEELLAICSRCSDGAEHTYCMRIMSAKVTEGEWLCEECQLKETADKVTRKSEAQISRIESPPPEENNQNNEFSKENKAIDPDIRRDNEELANLFPSKRKREAMEVDSVSKEKVNEVDGASTGTNVPSKPSQFSHENCKKAASDILKPFPTTCEKLEGTLSKSISFNNSKVPKVKQLLNNVPWEQNLAKESNLTNKRSKGPSQGITKSALFRSESCVETSSKAHAHSMPHPENSSGVKQVIGGTMLGKRNSSDYQFASPVLSAKSNMKIQSCDAELKRISDSNNLAGSKGSNDATGIANEGKKQPSANLSQTSGGTSVVRFYKNEEQKPFLPPPKFAMLRHRDDKAKDQTFIHSKQAASVPNQCHKCNEIGHPTQCCPVDKHHMTAMTPSSDRSLRDVDNRSIKQKSAFEILSWKLGTKRKSPEQFEEVSLAHADVNSEETTKTVDAVHRNMPSVESTMDVQDFRKESITIQKKLKVNKKSVGVPGSETDLDFANDLAAMPVIQNLSDQASIEIDVMRTSVIPEINYIWQGAFEVLTSTRSLTVLDGFQAHLSSYVSPIAHEVAGQLPCKVQLEEVPRLSSWPLQFCENNPKEDNIAIFFFAKNIDSYENYYWKLMDNILKNDLALIGVVGPVELLIFPSNLLPENSQRWNNLFYLWGLFRGRQENSLRDLPGLNERSPVNSLNMKSASKDLSLQTGTEVCSAIEISDDTRLKVTRSDKLLKANSSNYSSCIDLQAIPISGNENEEQPLVEVILHKNVPDHEEQTNQISCSHPAACSFRSMNHDNSVCVLRPESKFQIDIEQMPSEMEKDIHSSDKFTSDSDCRKDPKHHIVDACSTS